LAGVRPENVSIRNGNAPGKVLVVEDTGPARICLIAWQGIEIRALLPPGSSCKAGHSAWPEFASDSVHIWPKS
jgi:ABC-type sugar transport system ATPase subunit